MKSGILKELKRKLNAVFGAGVSLKAKQMHFVALNLGTLVDYVTCGEGTSISSCGWMI